MKKRIARLRERVSLRYRKFKKGLYLRWVSMPTFATARILLLALGVFILVAMIYLAQASNAAILARDLRVKQLEIQEIERENAQLRYEIAALASPSAIEQRARRLGLGPAKRVVYAKMPWIQPSPNELMPAFLPEGHVPSTPQTFSPTMDTLQELLALFGLDGFADSANAQVR
ncbi:MAG: septum formation initiator family protein [Anaerolineae bacterium]|nr:septum formation initiator family protein [Anaerolineae bacterium]